jgi:hypothetical protein
VGSPLALRLPNTIGAPGLSGDPAIYVSGGAEHQGPPGGGLVTVLWELTG